MSNSEGVKESSAYPTYSPFTHNAKALSAPSKRIEILSRPPGTPSTTGPPVDLAARPSSSNSPTSPGSPASPRWKVVTYTPTGLNSVGTSGGEICSCPSHGY